MQEIEAGFMKNMNVLYVEDDILVASQTLNLLKHFFHTVLHCSNAEDAMELFMSESIHLIITDIELPGMDGLQFCEKIRKINQQIPIFITTIHDDKEKLQQAIKLNLVDYLVKPVSVPSIQKTLMESLERVMLSGTLSVAINDKISYNPLQGHLDVLGQNIPVPLTHTEIKLFDLLLQYKNQVLPRETIEQTISPDKVMSDSSFKSLLFRLRKKIGKDSIVSLSGTGIKLVITRS